MKNKTNKMKGQFSIDFYISFIFFIMFVIYLFFQISKIIPNYLNEVNVQTLRSEAYQISELLINDLGEPKDWNILPEDQRNKIKRIGLLDETQNKTNLISQTKATALNTICNSADGYEMIKSKIATDYQFSLILINRVNNETLINCFVSGAMTKPIRVDMRRIVAFDNSYGELILQMW